MKAVIYTIALTFGFAGFLPAEADARPRSRAPKARSHRSAPKATHRTARRHRQPARTYRAPARRYRQPVRRYRQPTRRYHKPTRRYRKPTRRYYRKPVRRHYRRPHYRVYPRVYVPTFRTVTLTNSRAFGVQIAVRTGNSPVCADNAYHGSFWVGAGRAASVSTRGTYVCYRQLPTSYGGGTGWFRSVITSSYMHLSF